MRKRSADATMLIDARTRAGIVARIEQGIASGELHANANVRILSTVFDRFLLGLSTLAKPS
ncbi:hypothetical protein IHE29_07895 [Mycetohabitans rhizoxinica]|uniref:Transcriptional regulator, TetR family n=2 Tax=Burkholderiaceae TaxID=119060 RepID=A0ABZ2PVS4_9BURK